jgi:CHAD domain-containing protein
LELDRDTARKLNRRFKRVTQQLGIVRELDVLAMLIDELRRSRHYSRAGLTHVGSAVASARDAARQRLADKLSTGKLEKLADRLKRAAKPLEAHDGHHRPDSPAYGWFWALEARMAHRADLVRTAIDGAGAMYDSQKLHAVRIALKKLRYAAELSQETGGRRLTREVARLRAGQDLLGRLHDLEVLVSWGREVEASMSPPSLEGWRKLGALVHAVEDECRQLHARFMRQRSKLLAVASLMSATKRPAAGRRRAVR